MIAPLAGKRVLDLGALCAQTPHALAASMAARLCAAYGAEVVRPVPASGEPFAQHAPLLPGGGSALDRFLNAGKRCGAVQGHFDAAIGDDAALRGVDALVKVRLCSGRLWKGMRLKQVRTGKQVPVNAPLFFFAKDRQVAEEAWPGDVVGVANHGILRIGDTLTEGEELNFRGVPSFAPEILRHVRLEDPMLAKKLRTALDQLAEEGVVQLFRPLDGSPPVVGVVGQLQLDVLASRLKVEYGVPAGFNDTNWTQMRWVVSDDKAQAERFRTLNHRDCGEDHDNELVAFFSSDWRRKRSEEEFPGLRFHAVREQHGVEQMQR